MNTIIDKVEIYGLWDRYDFDLKLSPNINFLIGSNGTGKTTVLRLLTACLNLDLVTIRKIYFRKILLVLFDKDNKCKPSILVEKSVDNHFTNITYKIKDKQTSKYKVFSITDTEIRKFDRDNLPYSWQRKVSLKGETLKESIIELRRILKQFANIKWLPINRNVPKKARSYEYRELKHENTVDEKLLEIQENLKNYILDLQAVEKKELINFQQNVFLSTLQIPFQNEKEIFSTLEFDEATLHNINNMFKEMEFEKHYESLVDKQFQRFKELLEKYPGKPTLIDTFTLFIQIRLNDLNNKWKEYLPIKEDIYMRINNVIDLLNKTFLSNKSVSIEKGEIVIKTNQNQLIRLLDLSSGEKQLIIFLFEVLLFDEKAFTFVADEPELSLHVDWQENLVDNILNLNPSIQIIFATHSPDIVSRHSQYAIEMEKYLK